MRRASGIVLWIIATVSGVLGAAWFSLAGLGWSHGFIKRIYWDESESGIGVAFAIGHLLVWLALLAASIAVLRGGNQPSSRASKVTSVVLTTVSVVLVVIACLVAIGTPEPPSEFPTPPWNRA